MRYLGIDPGINGHLVLLEGKYKVLMTVPVPVIEVAKGRMLDVPGLWQVVDSIRVKHHSSLVAGIERVGPTMGIKAMFNFGGVYFSLQTALVAASIPFEFIEPKVWLKHFQLSGSTKHKSRMVAGTLFPTESFVLKKDIDKAEATLIARYLADTHSDKITMRRREI